MTKGRDSWACRLVGRSRVPMLARYAAKACCQARTRILKAARPRFPDQLWLARTRETEFFSFEIKSIVLRLVSERQPHICTKRLAHRSLPSNATGVRRATSPPR